MDKLPAMDRERIAAEGVTRDNFKIFEEELSRDKYGTREVPTVSPLASDKPLQHAYKWFSAAERLANSGAPNLNFDNLVRNFDFIREVVRKYMRLDISCGYKHAYDQRQKEKINQKFEQKTTMNSMQTEKIVETLQQ